MGKNYFLSTLFLMSAFFLQAQEISLTSAANTISEWENMISQEQNRKSDTVSIKNFLKPLKDRNSKSDRIIYDALLANAYAISFDKINTKSDYYYKTAIQNAKESDYKSLEIWATLSYAEYMYNYRQMTKSLPFFLAAIDKMQQTEPTQLIFPGQSYTKIGFYMDTIGDNAEAIKYLNKAKEFTKPNSSDYASILDNLGMSYFKVGNLTAAEKNIREASKLAQSIGDHIRYAKTLGNLALFYERKHDYNTAIKLLLEDISISEENGNEQNSMYAYTLLTRMYIANNQIVEAKTSVKKACEIAQSKSYFKINELDILKLRLNILHRENREDEELGIRRRIETLEDSLNKTDGVLPLNQANWMLQKRKYQQNIEVTNKELSTQSFWKNFIFTVAGLLILAVLFIFITARNREKKKQREMDKKIAEYENSRLKNERNLLDAHRTLDSQIDFLKEKNIQIQKLHTEIQNIKASKSSTIEKDQGKLNDILKSHLMTEENWLSFKREFQREHETFYKTLQESFPEITDSNLRIILLQKLGFTNSEISGLLGITIDAVKKSKQRLKHKLGEKYDLLFQMIISAN